MEILRNPLAIRVQRYSSRILRLIILIASITAFFNKNWEIGIIALIIFGLTFIPIIFEKQSKIYLPSEFELIITLFIFAAIYLGELNKYYQIYWWWDIMLHMGSAMAIGFIGFIIMYILYYSHKLETKPIWFAIFAFCFALAIGAIWEIFEFSVDQLLGTNMQKSGLVDTMWDLIVDAIGALITATVGFIYLKRKKHSLFAILLEKFFERNPKYKPSKHPVYLK